MYIVIDCSKMSMRTRSTRRRGNSGDHEELSPGNETDRDVRDIAPSRLSASRSSHSIERMFAPIE